MEKRIRKTYNFELTPDFSDYDIVISGRYKYDLFDDDKRILRKLCYTKVSNYCLNKESEKFEFKRRPDGYKFHLYSNGTYILWICEESLLFLFDKIPNALYFN